MTAKAGERAQKTGDFYCGESGAAITFPSFEYRQARMYSARL